MTDILGIGEALAPNRAARLYEGGGMFPHGGGLAAFPGIGRGRVAGIPEESGAPLRLCVRDEDARPDRLMEALRANIAPRRGESFEQYNGRLNEARAEVAAMVSDARRRGVKINGSYGNNCISTVSANYNDRSMAGTNGRYYDPNGIYQSFSAEHNPDFASRPDEYGFKKVFSYIADKDAAGVHDGDDLDTALPKMVKYRRKAMSPYEFKRGDIANVIAREDSRDRWTPKHAVMVSDRDDDGRLRSDYAPGSEGDSRYEHGSSYFLDGKIESLNRNDYYRYVGTPGEQRNRRLYYDEYRRQEKEHDAMDASFRRHHANVERQLKSPEFWGVQIELPEHIWRK